MASRAVEQYKRYVTAFSASTDEQERSRILQDILLPNFRYETPTLEGSGTGIVLEDIRAFQGRFPGGSFVLYSSSEHHNVALMEWQLILADGTPSVRGHDAVQLTPEGRFAEIVTFGPSDVEGGAVASAEGAA